jgi:hypothetical protein
MAPKVCVDSVYSEAEVLGAAPRQSRRIGDKFLAVQKAKDRCRGFLEHQLVRVGCRGNSLPPIGQACVVMKGTAGKDEGQMGFVTGKTRAMVEVTYVDETTGKPNVRLKRPSSLVMLEPGLCLAQDPDGAVWIRSRGSGCPDE